MIDATPPSGWRSLPGLGVDMSAPLWCVRPPAPGVDYARHSYRDALQWCDEHDFALLTADACEASRDGATVLEPVTFPNGIGSYAEHDRIVRERLERAGPGPVIGIGKHWIAGAPPGRSWLMGWWVKELRPWTYDPKKKKISTRTGPGWVQPRPAPGSPGPHDDLHVDYSSTTIVLRPTARLFDVVDLGVLDLARSLFLGDGSEEPEIVRLARSQIGVSETSGRNDGQQIKRYFAGVSRKIGGVERPLEWVSGWDWCAAFVSWCAGSAIPHRRISVRELCEDARERGTLETSRSYEPRPGDLYVGARGGGDPLLGGTGHTRIFVSRVSGSLWEGIGGNEDNRVRHSKAHRFDDPTWRAWIRTGRMPR